MGWQTSLAATCFVSQIVLHYFAYANFIQASGQQITALIALSHKTYTSTEWQVALLSWAILFLCIFMNTVLFRRLPLIEGVVTFLHVLGFFAFVIVLWYVIYMIHG